MNFFFLKDLFFNKLKNKIKKKMEENSSFYEKEIEKLNFDFEFNEHS